MVSPPLASANLTRGRIPAQEVLKMFGGDWEKRRIEPGEGTILRL
jgi:hypothetical protein